MPTKKEKYLENYNKRKETYLNNRNIDTMEAGEKVTRVSQSIGTVMNMYASKRLDTLSMDEFYSLFDKIYGKSDVTKKAVDKVINTVIDNSKYKGIKEELKDKGINTKSFIELSKSGNEKYNNLHKDLASALSSTLFTDNLDANIEIFDTILENTEFNEEFVPDEKLYTTYLDNEEMLYEFNHEDDRNRLIRINNNANTVDIELDRYLKESKYTLASAEDSRSTLGKYGEAIGTKSNEIFMKGFKEFMKDDKYFLFEENVPFETADELLDFNKKNILNVTSSSKHKETLINSIKLLEKNDIHGERVTGVFNNDAKELNELIYKSKPKAFKAKYKEYDNKIKVVDEIIKNMKEVDPKHLFTSNFTTFRNPTYPPKYLLDAEGNTLINCVLEVDKMCRYFNVDPVEYVNDPIKGTRDIYQKQEELCKNGMNKIFRNENSNLFDIFRKRDGYELGFKEYEDAQNIDTEVGYQFPQVISSLTINNPENRYEYFLSVQNGILTATKAHELNTKEIVKATKDDFKMVNEIMPAVILAGDKFNPYKMINTENGMIDIAKQERRKDFDLSMYLESVPTNTIDARMEAARAEALKSDLLKSDEVMVATSKIVKEAIMSRSKVDERLVDRLVDHYSGKITLKNAEKNTILSSITFGEMVKNGVTKDNIRISLETIADLNKKYKSHNFLARVFSPSLRKQNKAITEMKNEIATLSGISREGIDDYIKISESKSVDKDEAIDAYLSGLDIKEDKKYEYECTKEDLKNSLLKEDFYLSREDLEFKLSLVDKEIETLSEKPMDERDKEIKNLKTLSNKKLEFANKCMKINKDLSREDCLTYNDKISDGMRDKEITESIKEFESFINEADKNPKELEKSLKKLASLKEPLDLTNEVAPKKENKEIKEIENVKSLDKEIEKEKEVEINIGGKNE